MSIDKLSLGEVEDIEDIIDRPLAILLTNPDVIPAKALAAIAYIIERRTNPDITIADMRAKTYEEVLGIFVAAMGTDDDPKAGAPTTPAPTASAATTPNSAPSEPSPSATSTDGPQPRFEL